MATADLNMDSGILEIDENAIRQREILSRCFSEARQRLDERERELSLQLEQKLREDQIHKKKLDTDRLQLKSVSEQVKASLSSNYRLEAWNETGRVFQQLIHKLREEEKIVQFDWSPQRLFSEISKIGEVSLLPVSTEDSSVSNNCKSIKLEFAPSLQAEKQEIHSLLSQELVNGQEWYLIHIRWFKQWKSYVGYDNWDKSNAGDEVMKPGPIDNTPLLDNGKLRRHLVDEKNYKLVPALAWDKLISWYGITVDSVGIKRQVIEYSKFIKHYGVEVYPLELKACVYPKENEFKIVILSRSDTIHTLDRKIRELYYIAPDRQTRISNRYAIYPYQLIEDMNKEAQNVGLLDGHCVLLEVQNVDGTWPKKVILF